MRTSRSLGIIGTITLLLAGATGCAGVHPRAAWSAAPSADSRAAGGWLLSRWWRQPAPTSVTTPTPNPALDRSWRSKPGRPELDIWPERVSRRSGIGLTGQASFRGGNSTATKEGPVSQASPTDRSVQPVSAREEAMGRDRPRSVVLERERQGEERIPSEVSLPEDYREHSKPDGVVALQVAPADLPWESPLRGPDPQSSSEGVSNGESAAARPGRSETANRSRTETGVYPLFPPELEASSLVALLDAPASGAARQAPQQDESRGDHAASAAAAAPGASPAPPPRTAGPGPSPDGAPSPSGPEQLRRLSAPPPLGEEAPPPPAEDSARINGEASDDASRAPSDLEQPSESKPHAETDASQPAPASGTLPGLRFAPPPVQPISATASAAPPSGQGSVAEAAGARWSRAAGSTLASPQSGAPRGRGGAGKTAGRWSLLGWLHRYRTSLPEPQPQLPPPLFPTTYNVASPRAADVVPPRVVGVIHPAPQGPIAASRVPPRTHAGCTHGSHPGLFTSLLRRLASWTHCGCCHCQAVRPACCGCAACGHRCPSVVPVPAAAAQSPRIFPQPPSVGVSIPMAPPSPSLPELGFSVSAEPRDLAERRQVLDRIAAHGLGKPS